ncbi:MAG: PAS domain S-box protein, partial [Fidelibacterota bacterium]
MSRFTPPQKEYFVTIFTDISAQKIISEIAAKFNEFNAESLDFNYIADKAREISGAKFAVLNKFDKNGRDFSTVAFSGMNQHLKKGISLLGFDFIGKKWNYDPEREKKIAGSKTTVFEKLTDLTGDVISKNITNLLCKTFKIGKTAVVKTTKDGKMLGDFTLLFSRNDELQNRELMETFADLTGMLIKRLDSEQEIIESEKLQKSLLKNISAGIMIVDPETKEIEIVNKYAQELIGLPENEIIGKICHQFVCPAHVNRCPVCDIGQTVDNSEKTLLTPGGTEIPILKTVKYIQINGKEKLIESFVDITDRKKIEGELKENQDSLQAVLRSTADGILAIGKDKKILYANERFSELWRIPPELLESRDDETLLQLILDQVTDPEGFLMKAEELYNSDKVDLDVINFNDGRVFERLSRPLLRGPEITGRVWSFRDITDRKLAEKKLKESHKLFDLFFHESLEGFFFMMLDEPVEWNDNIDKEKALDYVFSNQLITKINDAMLQQYRAKEEDFLKLTPNDLFSHDLKHGREVWKKLFDKGKFHIDTTEKKLDGTDMSITGNYICLYDEKGRITGHFGVQRDVTEDRKNKEALKESERQLNRAQHTAKIGNWIWYIPENELWWSDEMYNIFEIDKDAFTGKLDDVIERAIHPEDKKAVEQSNFSVMVKNKPIPVEYRINTRDGKQKYVLGLADKVTLDENGKSKILTGIVKDITDYKLAQIELIKAKEKAEKSQKKLKEAQRIAHMGNWELDIEANELFWSDEIFRIFDCEPQEFDATYEAFLEFIHPDDREMVNSAYLKSLETKEEYQIDHRILTKDNQIKIVREKCRTTFNDHGKPLTSFGIVIDITRQKEAEQELEMFKIISDNAVYGKAITDLKGNIIYINNFFANIHGYIPEELIGQNLSLFHNPKQMEVVKRLNNNLLKKGYYPPTEVWHINHKGTEFPMLMSGIVIKDETGKPLHIAGSAVDITDQKALEEQNKQLEQLRNRSLKLETIGTLAGGIAHNINNLLTPIMGYSNMIKIRAKNTDEDLYEEISEILQASKKARDLVEQMLHFSLADDQERSFVNIVPVIKDTVELLRSSIPEFITIDVNITQSEVYILADPAKISQVVMNLATNAFHSMEEKGGKLTISLENMFIDGTEMFQYLDLPEGNYLLLKVADTGTGMDAKTIERIFDPFFTTKEEGKGKGMGLSVVHGIIKSHDGAIHVESEPGKGTHFYIYLPIIEDQKSNNTSGSENPLSGGTERIMVVDDREYISKMIKNMLTSYGYQ